MDWNGFKKTAIHLENKAKKANPSDGEAYNRCSVSRLCYYVFHTLKNRFNLHLKRKSPHEDLRRKLNRLHKKEIADKYADLRHYRNQADYEEISIDHLKLLSDSKDVVEKIEKLL